MKTRYSVRAEPVGTTESEGNRNMIDDNESKDSDTSRYRNIYECPRLTVRAGREAVRAGREVGP